MKHVIVYWSVVTLSFVAEPLPMKLRALPSSFWEPPHTNQSPSPGYLFAPLPPLTREEAIHEGKTLSYWLAFVRPSRDVHARTFYNGYPYFYEFQSSIIHALMGIHLDVYGFLWIFIRGLAMDSRSRAINEIVIEIEMRMSWCVPFFPFYLGLWYQIDRSLITPWIMNGNKLSFMHTMSWIFFYSLKDNYVHMDGFIPISPRNCL